MRVSIPGSRAPTEREREAIWREAVRHCPDFDPAKEPDELHVWKLAFYERIELVRVAWLEAQKPKREVFALYEPGVFRPVDESGDTLARADKTAPLRLQGSTAAETHARLEHYIAVRLALLGSSADGLGRGGPLQVRLLNDEIARAVGLSSTKELALSYGESRDANGELVFVVRARILQQELGQQPSLREVLLSVWLDGHLLIEPSRDDEAAHVGSDDLHLASNDRGLWTLPVRTIPAPPAFLAWKPADATIAASLGKAIQGEVTSMDTLVVRSAELPFYRNFVLVQATVGEARCEVRYALCRPQGDALDIVSLSGASRPIHDANDSTTPEGHTELRPELTNSEEYLAFFCWAVDGDEGHFLIPSSPGDLTFTAALSPEQDECIYGARARFTISREDVDGVTHWGARVFYGNALFDARFVINTGGEIEMLDDQPVVDRLPVERQAFGSGGLISFSLSREPVVSAGEAAQGPSSSREMPRPAREAAAALGMSLAGFESLHGPELRAPEQSGLRLVADQVFDAPYVMAATDAESVAFLRCTFLRGFRLRTKTSSGSLSFVGCVFSADAGAARDSDVAVDLGDCECNGSLTFERCVLEGRLQASGLRVSRSLRLRGVRIARNAGGIACSLTRELFDKTEISLPSVLREVLREGSTFTAIALRGCNVGSELELSFDSVKDDGEIGELSVVAGDIDLTGCRVEGGLLLAGLWCAGDLTLASASVAKGLLASVRWYSTQFRCTTLNAELAQFGGSIDLAYASFRGSCRLVLATITGWLDLMGCQIRGEFSLLQSTVRGAVRLDGLTVTGDAILRLSKIEGRLRAERATRVNGEPARFGGDLELSGADISSLEFRGAVVEGRVRADSGHFGAIKFTLGAAREAQGGLWWPAGCALGQLEFAGVEVDGDVELAGVQVHGTPWTSFRSTSAKAPLRSSVALQRCKVGGHLVFSLSDPCFELERWLAPMVAQESTAGESPKQKVASGRLVRWGIGNTTASSETLPTQAHVKSTIQGDLDLRGSQIGGNLNLQNTLLDAKLVLDDTKVAVDIEARCDRSDSSGQTKYDLETSCGAFSLEGLECGGTLALTGLRVLSRGRSARRRLSLPHDKTTGDFQGRGATIKGTVELSAITSDTIPGASPTRVGARIEGRFDLSASTVERLILDHSSFPKRDLAPPSTRGWKVNLERATISRFDVRLLPPPLDLTAVSIQRWEVIRDEGQSGDEADEYIHIMKAMRPLDRSVWTGIEQSLRNHANNRAADRVYVALRDEMRRRRRASETGRAGGIALLEWLHGALFAYGTAPGRAFWAFNALLMPLMFLIALRPGNMSASDDQLATLANRCRPEANVTAVCTAYRRAISREGLDVQLSPVDLGTDWTLRDSLAIWLRYELPIIAVTTDTDWVPSTRPSTTLTSRVELGASPRSFAFLAMIGNWVLLPLYVAFLAARLVRRAA
jgi:hypothetical protein